MSAYQCDPSHLAYLVGIFANVCSGQSRVILRTTERPVDNRVGSQDIMGGVFYELHPDDGITDRRMVYLRLARENARSVGFRYRAGCEPVPCPLGERFPLVMLRTVADIAQAVKAIDCYEYQACEHPEWEASEVRRWLVALRREVLRRMPGFADAYESAAWGAPAAK